MTQSEIGRFRDVIAAYISRVEVLKGNNPQFVLNKDLCDFAKADGPLPEVIVAGLVS